MRAIDLSKLPAPEVLSEVDYEQLLQEALTAYGGSDCKLDAQVESEPIMQVLRAMTSVTLSLKQAIQESVSSVFLATAKGTHLEHLGATLGVVRLPQEPDDAFRIRIQQAPYGLSTTGPKESYRQLARQVSDDILDVGVFSNSPGVVEVIVLSIERECPEALLEAVSKTLCADEVRPLTDKVVVKPATIIEFNIEAELHLESGPDSSVALDVAFEAAQTFLSKQYALGNTVHLSALMAKLHQPGVKSVRLLNLDKDLEVGSHEAALCTNIELRAR